MPSSTAAASAWPEPGRVALGLAFGFAVALASATVWGSGLIEVLLPLVAKLILWLDDNFAILALSIDHTTQDTVVRLRVNLTQVVVVGGIPTRPDPKGWLEVTTTTGAMLQPLVIGCALALGWPARWSYRITRLALAFTLAFGFLLLDVPVTLHAYVWDMFVYHNDPHGFSPLLTWHEALNAGGRLGMGLLFGGIAIRALRRSVQDESNRENSQSA